MEHQISPDGECVARSIGRAFILKAGIPVDYSDYPLTIHSHNGEYQLPDWNPADSYGGGLGDIHPVNHDIFPVIFIHSQINRVLQRVPVAFGCNGTGEDFTVEYGAAPISIGGVD